MRLKGKTALVTGSGRSLGKACALRLAQEGANIVVNSRGTPEEAEAVAGEVRALGVDSIAVVADVTDPAQVEEMRRQVAERYGAVDILVNNVGVSPYVPMLDLEPDDWHQIMDINLHSLFYVTRAFLRPMVDKGWGRIVNIAGHVAFMQRTRGVHTAASTAGKISFTRALATEVAPFGRHGQLHLPRLHGHAAQDQVLSRPEGVRPPAVDGVPGHGGRPVPSGHGAHGPGRQARGVGQRRSLPRLR